MSNIYFCNTGLIAWGQTDDDKWYVRPLNWAGIWDKNGKLDCKCNVIESFDCEEDCKSYLDTHDFSDYTFSDISSTIIYKGDTAHPVIDSPRTLPLNVNKIKSLNDVKRILEYLNITVTLNGLTAPTGYEKVKDLFE